VHDVSDAESVSPADETRTVSDDDQVFSLDYRYVSHNMFTLTVAALDHKIRQCIQRSALFPV